MVLHIILRHFKGKLMVCSHCQLLHVISISVSSKIKIHFFIIFIFFLCVCVCIDQFYEGSLLLKIY